MARSTRPAILESSRSLDDVFAAIRQFVQDGGFQLGGVSNEQREILFKSAKTATSPQHYYVAGVVESEAGAVLQLTTSASGISPFAKNGPKNEAAGAAVIEAVRSLLDSGAELSPRPMESHAVLRNGDTVPWTSGDFPGF